MLTAPDIYISRHAVEQYRARALFCCERYRTDDMLRGIIKEQIKGRSWRCAGGETFVVECGPVIPKTKKPWEYKLSSITHTFVIECQSVVTTLGYMMRPNHRRKQRLRRRMRLAQRCHSP